MQLIVVAHPVAEQLFERFDESAAAGQGAVHIVGKVGAISQAGVESFTFVVLVACGVGSQLRIAAGDAQNSLDIFRGQEVFED